MRRNPFGTCAPSIEPTVPASARVSTAWNRGCSSPTMSSPRLRTLRSRHPDVPDPLTLGQAITEADADSGPDTISFGFVPKNIPGVVNFDLTNQVWEIDVDNNVPLPPITGQVSIDGYTQSYVSGKANPNVFQKVQITGSPTGGIFTLTFEGETTAAIPFNATAAQVQSALEALPNIGPGNAETILGPSIPPAS